MTVRYAAAFLEPEILIIDEVLAVGDAEFEKAIGKMQISMQGDGAVCESIAAVSTLATRT
jgi:lipopolysaccharide transport system ATP-binding protein